MRALIEGGLIDPDYGREADTKTCTYSASPQCRLMPGISPN
jgi:hypothetical protein